MVDRLASEDLSFVMVKACEGTDPEVRRRAPSMQRDIEFRIVACLVSHLRALKAFLASPADEGIICEDDVRPLKGFAARFLARRENIPDDVPLVALGYLVWRWEGFVWSGRDHTKENLTTVGADLWGTQMYLARRPWAQECVDRFDLPIDEIVTNQVKTAELITRDARFRGGLVAYPPLAITDLSGSILNPEAGNANHPEAIKGWDSSLYVP